MNNNRQKPRIFINYRWTDTGHEARWLRSELEHHLGLDCNVFKDKRISEGTKWADEIKKQLAAADVVLVLIGKKWFTCRKTINEYVDIRWLDHPDCWVRREIEAALATGKHIFPVLFDHAHWPDSEEKAAQAFPPSIRVLHAYKPFRIDTNQSDDRDLQALLERLREKLNLPLNVKNRVKLPNDILAGFPLPPVLQRRLPKEKAPYPGLHYFTEQNARLFFGRGKEILDIWGNLQLPECQGLLLYGYSGVGKSSLLHAGLLPRIKNRGWVVHIERRDRERGLKAQFDLLSNQLMAGKPGLIVLDQAEEAFTDPHPERPEEMKELFDLLAEKLVFYPQLKIILGFRKEFLPELRDELDRVDLRFYNCFLKPLGRKGISEAITGAANEPALAEYYQFKLSPGLAETMTQDICRNEEGLTPEAAAGKAPLLQIQLRNLWDASRQAQPDGEIELSEKLYREKIRQENMGAQLEEQLAQLPQKLTDLGEAALKNGLALDILWFLTTARSTAATRRVKALQQRYPPERKKDINRLTRALEDLHLLVRLDNHAIRLAHDAWAPFIRERFNNSDAPAQRAWRIVESKRRDIEQGRNVQFSKTDLDAITEGMEAMPEIPQNVAAAIRKSAEALEEDRRRFAKIQQDNLDFLLDRVDTQILHLQYTQAFDTLRGAGELGARQAEIARRWQELAFFHHESGNDKVGPFIQEQLQEMGLSIPAYPSDKKSVQEWLRKIDPNHFVELTNRYFPVMRKVKGGTFKMGDKERENAPPHEVQLDSFSLAQTAATFWQYGLYCGATGKKILDNSPSWGIFGDNPVVNVRWYEAVEYANWLSEKLGLTPVYQIDRENKDPNNNLSYDDWKWTVFPDWKANGFRLPTEAEWEYAARGGKQEKEKNFLYAGSNELDEVGWYHKNARMNGVNRTHPVAQLKPNGLGLYDMSGNVREWCWDWYNDKYYEKSLLANPNGPSEGKYRVVRGGSWIDNDYYCRVSFRYNDVPNLRYSYIGCRFLQG